MRAALAISLGVLSLACFAVADTQFYQDASFLELVTTQPCVLSWMHACHFNQHVPYRAKKYHEGDVMSAGQVQSLSRPALCW